MSDEINEEEVFEKKESKIGLKLKSIFTNKKIILGIVIVLIIIALAVLELITGMISGLFYHGVGNTVGNISNCGYSVAKDNYIYYVAPGEDMENTNIYRTEKGSTDSELLFEGSYDIRALNISGNKIYFIAISYDNATDESSIDNKIYKMDLDGSNQTVINDNEFAYDYYDMYVVKNRIYYVGEDYKVYKMDLNGGNRKLVLDTEDGYLAISEKYIVYNKPNDDDTDYITYIKSLNKDDEKQLTGGRLSTPDIQGDYVYYINDDQNIARVSINGGDEEVIFDGSAYNMNIYNGNIYYLNYKDEENADYTVCIYKISVDGGDPELVKEFSYYSSFINVIDDYIYYMDMDEEKAFINLVNINDVSEIELNEWSYGDESSDDETEEVTDETVTEESVEDTTETSEETDDSEEVAE